MIDFFDTSVFPCSEIIAHQGSYALDNAVGSQIDEGLQLVIYAENKDIFVRKICQHSIQSGNQQ